MHIISGFPRITEADTTRYDTPSIGSDTDPIIVRFLKATAWNLQAIAAADITASWLLLLTKCWSSVWYIYDNRVHISLSGYQFVYGYLDAQVPADRPKQKTLKTSFKTSLIQVTDR